VILTTLEKEEGLVTATSPTSGQYQIAMGFGCPDTAACDSQYYGFYNQVYKAAWQFAEYTKEPSIWRYKVGAVAIQYSPNASCGSSTVQITNQATANLYNYTPYQPNAAALANLYGTGNSCSSYGNRNFWTTYSDWFGSPTGAPIGALDGATASVSATAATLDVRGWTFDSVEPAAQTFADVYVTDPKGVQTGHRLTADQVRTDVGTAYPGAGNNHGYSASLSVTQPGTYQVCVYGIGAALPAGSGQNTLLKCQNVVVPGGPPTGSLDSVALVNSSSALAIQVGGWTLDPSTPTISTFADVYITAPNGVQSGHRMTASGTRSDVANNYPGAGAAHGFSGTYTVTQTGVYQVCVFSIGAAVFNVGNNPLLGCKSVTVAPGAYPIGSLDSAKIVQTSSAATLDVSGWTLDTGLPTTPTYADIYVTTPAGVMTGYHTLSSGSRPDVARVFTNAGANHGYTASIPVTQLGTYRVCVFAIGIYALSVGKNTLLSCQSVTVAAASPIGSLDSVRLNATTSGETLSISGWALDPGLPTSPTYADVYVTSPSGQQLGHRLAASYVRADVGKVFPGTGVSHGFSTEETVTQRGTYQVCAFSIGTAYFDVGHNTLLRCVSVVY
jgi:hypothetical protein